jgi:hypothetical protein
MSFIGVSHLRLCRLNRAAGQRCFAAAHQDGRAGTAIDQHFFIVAADC